MSSKKTDYLKMHDWTEADPWRLAEVSENFKKMDKKAKDLDSSMAATVSTAADAKTTATGIDAKATDALTKSTEAVQNVTAAVQKANSAETKATEAKTVSDNALAKAGTAESIANGVQTQFNQVVITGDSSVEAAQARVNTSGQTYSTLKQRLDSEHQEVTVKLAETSSEIQSVDAKVKGIDRGYGGTYQTLAELQAAFPVGNDNRYVVSADGKWYFWKDGLWTAGGVFQGIGIGAKEVTEEMVNFVNISSNLFNQNSLEDRRSVNGTTGALQDSTNPLTAHRDFIKVEPGTRYTSLRLTRIAHYDKNKVFLYVIETATPATAYTWITPTNGGYVRAHGSMSEVYNSSNPAQINKGTSLLPYERYYVQIDNSKISVNVDDIGIEQVDFIDKSPNLFRLNTLRYLRMINSTTGELSPTNEGMVAEEEYVKVKPLTKYSTAQIFRVAFYDKQKRFIASLNIPGAETAYTFTTPPNCAYIRYHTFKILLENKNQPPQINEGTVLSPYEESFYRLGDLKTKDVVRKRNKPYYFPPQDLTGAFKAKAGTYKDFTLPEFYAALDDLVERFPHILSKKIKGLDTSGTYEVWQMELSSPSIETSKVNNKRPKIILSGGVHGSEKPTSIGLYYAIKAICEDWRSDELLAYLRWNVDIVFIPCVNPHSYVSGVYAQNANGVDIQKNMPVLWEKAPADLGRSYGTQPLSEVETQYYKQMIDENSDAFYFGELHASGWGASFSDIMYHSLTNFPYPELEIATDFHIKRMTAEFIKNYNLPENQGYVGWLARNNSAGSPKVYAASIGIPSSVFELFYKLPNEDAYSSNTMKAVSEAIVNWILILVSQYRQIQN